MEWQLALLLIFGTLIILFATGMPIAFAFVIVNVVGAIIFWGGEAGLQQLVLSMFKSVATYSLFPVVFFCLMGEVMFQSGLAVRLLDTLGKLLGHLPGRLSLLAVGTGAVLASMTGTSMATTAILGTLLVPEMEKRGYKKAMTLGPTLGSASLAIMIPPSALAVLLGAIGRISVGKILIAIYVPGLLLAALYATYIIIRCKLQPSLAPSYEVTPTPLSEKVVDTIRYVLPVGVIIFLVVGVIFLGIASPSEASATGALGTVLLAASYRSLNWEVMKKSFVGALRITFMLFIILTGATAFSQILSFSGASRGLVELAMSTPLSPIFVIVLMLGLVVVMGCFLEMVSIMLITLPIFMPIIHALGFDPVWFAVVMLLSLVTGAITPPFGFDLFVLKGVAPPGTTMADIYRASIPFVLLELTAIGLIVAFPVLVLWLPGVMR